MRFEVERIVMMTSDDPRRSQDIALRIGDRQNIAGFGSLTRLVTHALPAFLGDGMAAVQVQPRQIQFVLDGHDAVLPQSLEAPIPAPFLKMVVHGLPTDFLFFGSTGSAAMGNCAHWQPV